MPNSAMLSAVRVLSRPAATRLSTLATPDSLAGLVAWGDAGDCSAVGNGNPVSSWLNKTLSGLDPAQATAANKPTYVASAINGQPAIRFTKASAQDLVFPAGALGWFNAVPGATLIAVVQPILAATAELLNAAIATTDAPRYTVGASAASYISRCRSDDSTASSISSGVAPGTASAIVAGLIDNANGAIRININGAQLNAGPITPAQSTPASNSHSVSIGGRADGTQFFDGYIASYAMWNVAYSRAQLDGVMRYWASKYAIPLGV